MLSPPSTPVGLLAVMPATKSWSPTWMARENVPGGGSGTCGLLMRRRLRSAMALLLAALLRRSRGRQLVGAALHVLARREVPHPDHAGIVLCRLVGDRESRRLNS